MMWQASMLEIYNESIRDLLVKAPLTVKQEYVVKHDQNGNTSVSDLTLVDVTNWKEVSSLLHRASQSRYQPSSISPFSSFMSVILRAYVLTFNQLVSYSASQIGSLCYWTFSPNTFIVLLYMCTSVGSVCPVTLLWKWDLWGCDLQVCRQDSHEWAIVAKPLCVHSPDLRCQRGICPSLPEKNREGLVSILLLMQQ